MYDTMASFFGLTGPLQYQIIRTLAQRTSSTIACLLLRGVLVCWQPGGQAHGPAQVYVIQERPSRDVFVGMAITPAVAVLPIAFELEPLGRPSFLRTDRFSGFTFPTSDPT